MARELILLIILAGNSIFCSCILLYFIGKKLEEDERLSSLDKFSIFALVTTVMYFAYQIWFR